MLIHILIALGVAACVAEHDREHEAASLIRCEPFCAPDDSYLPILREAVSYGFNLFPDAFPSAQNCADLGAQWDCVVTFQPPSNPCGARVVECIGEPPHPPRCSWSDPHKCP